jgi:hypothetical protein
MPKDRKEAQGSLVGVLLFHSISFASDTWPCTRQDEADLRRETEALLSALKVCTLHKFAANT